MLLPFAVVPWLCHGDDNYCACVTNLLAGTVSRPYTDGTALPVARSLSSSMAGRAFTHPTERFMNSIIYLVGLVVVVMAVLSFIGIH
jgi:hypothetical protein